MPEKIEEVKINTSNFVVRDIVKEEKSETDNEIKYKENSYKPESPEIDYTEEDNVEDRRKRLMIISRYKNSKRFGSWLNTRIRL